MFAAPPLAQKSPFLRAVAVQAPYLSYLIYHIGQMHIKSISLTVQNALTRTPTQRYFHRDLCCYFLFCELLCTCMRLFQLFEVSSLRKEDLSEGTRAHT